MPEYAYLPASMEPVPILGIANVPDSGMALDFMQGMVGGLIEYVPLGEQRRFPLPQFQAARAIDMICHEEGLLHNEPINVVATAIANMSHGQPAFSGPMHIVGDVILIFDALEEPLPLNEVEEWFEGMRLEVDDADGSSRLVAKEGHEHIHGMEAGEVFVENDEPNLNALRSLEAVEEEGEEDE